MQKRILVLVVSFMLIGMNGFAADRDLIVNGNVGIGTTTPMAKLHVQGNTIVSGNVGVGTTAPGYKLDVQGQIRATQGTAVYVMPSGCGGGLTTSATCRTLFCGLSEGIQLFYDCAGTCGNSALIVTCSTTLVGRLVAP